MLFIFIYSFSVTKEMKLKPHACSDKAFVWSTFADFADEEIKSELLAIRFRDANSMYCLFDILCC